MSPLHPARLPVEELLDQCNVRSQRRGGPGGQHRNKVETAIVIEHRPTGVKAEANERRSQAENRRQAVQRLQLRLAIEMRLHPPDQPSPLWQQRTIGGRIAVNPSHEDYPALLAEALDAVAAAEYDQNAAADRLGISASQLSKLLRGEPPAWTSVNDERRRRGLRPLK